MTINYLFYITILTFFTSLKIASITRSTDKGFYRISSPTASKDDEIIDHSRITTFEIDSSLIFAFFGIIAILTQYEAILLGDVFLVLAAKADIETQEVSDIFTFPVMLLYLLVGFQEGHLITGCIVAGLFILYLIFIEDSDILGGADVVLILAAFARFGFGYGLFSLIVACFVGILYKLLRWWLKIDEYSNNGIAFVPAITISVFITSSAQMKIGEMPVLSFEDISFLLERSQ